MCSRCEHGIFEFHNWQDNFWTQLFFKNLLQNYIRSNFYYYFHALICYHDFQISWIKIIMLSMLACTFTSWIIHEIMVLLLPWKFWFFGMDWVRYYKKHRLLWSSAIFKFSLFSWSCLHDDFLKFYFELGAP